MAISIVWRGVNMISIVSADGGRAKSFEGADPRQNAPRTPDPAPGIPYNGGKMTVSRHG